MSLLYFDIIPRDITLLILGKFTYENIESIKNLIINLSDTSENIWLLLTRNKYPGIYKRYYNYEKLYEYILEYEETNDISPLLMSFLIYENKITIKIDSMSIRRYLELLIDADDLDSIKKIINISEVLNNILGYDIGEIFMSALYHKNINIIKYLMVLFTDDTIKNKQHIYLFIEYLNDDANQSLEIINYIMTYPGVNNDDRVQMIITNTISFDIILNIINKYNIKFNNLNIMLDCYDIYRYDNQVNFIKYIVDNYYNFLNTNNNAIIFVDHILFREFDKDNIIKILGMLYSLSSLHYKK
jgi:hypothetical protein